MRIGFCSSAVGLLSGCLGDADAEPGVLLRACVVEEAVVSSPSVCTRSSGFTVAGGVASIFFLGVVVVVFVGSEMFCGE